MTYTHGQNAWGKVKKSSKIGQEQKSVITTFDYVLAAITKDLFLEGRLGTSI